MTLLMITLIIYKCLLIPMQAARRRSLRPFCTFLYLMTHYARTGCPRVALYVARHMQCLAVHPDASPLVRDICAGLHGAWQQAAGDLPENGLLH